MRRKQCRTMPFASLSLSRLFEQLFSVLSLISKEVGQRERSGGEGMRVMLIFILDPCGIERSPSFLWASRWALQPSCCISWPCKKSSCYFSLSFNARLAGVHQNGKSPNEIENLAWHRSATASGNVAKRPMSRSANKASLLVFDLFNCVVPIASWDIRRRNSRRVIIFVVIVPWCNQLNYPKAVHAGIYLRTALCNGWLFWPRLFWSSACFCSI